MVGANLEAHYCYLASELCEFEKNYCINKKGI